MAAAILQGLDMARVSEASMKGLSILRDPAQFKWYVVPLLLVVLYVYAKEAQHKKWSVIFGGLALWGMDWFNEIWNALVFHFTSFAPVWGAPQDTAYLILIGLNIEITFMFLIMGVMAASLLPADKKMKIFGINNRIVFAAVNTTLCVIVEIILNLGGWLTWEYSWWRPGFPFVLWLIGYLPFFAVCYWVHDMESTKKQAITTGAILGFDLVCLIIFGGVLRWI